MARSWVIRATSASSATPPSLQLEPGQTTRIGRSASCGIRTASLSVSRVHCTVSTSEDGSTLLLRDHSSFGTEILDSQGHTREQLGPQSESTAALRVGDRLRVGDVEFAVSYALELRVCCSKLSAAEIAELSALRERMRLSGTRLHVRRSWGSDCDALVVGTGKAAVTLKVLAALAEEKPVVELEWLKKVEQGAEWYDRAAEFAPKVFGKEVCFDYRECPRSSLFAGFVLVFLEKEQADAAEDMVRKLGGRVEKLEGARLEEEVLRKFSADSRVLVVKPSEGGESLTLEEGTEIRLTPLERVHRRILNPHINDIPQEFLIRSKINKSVDFFSRKSIQEEVSQVSFSLTEKSFPATGNSSEKGVQGCSNLKGEETSSSFSTREKEPQYLNSKENLDLLSTNNVDSESISEFHGVEDLEDNSVYKKDDRFIPSKKMEGTIKVLPSVVVAPLVRRKRIHRKRLENLDQASHKNFKKFKKQEIFKSHPIRVNTKVDDSPQIGFARGEEEILQAILEEEELERNRIKGIDALFENVMKDRGVVKPSRLEQRRNNELKGFASLLSF